MMIGNDNMNVCVFDEILAITNFICAISLELVLCDSTCSLA